MQEAQIGRSQCQKKKCKLSWFKFLLLYSSKRKFCFQKSDLRKFQSQSEDLNGVVQKVCVEVSQGADVGENSNILREGSLELDMPPPPVGMADMACQTNKSALLKKASNASSTNLG